MTTRYTALVNTPTTVTTDGPQGTGSLRTISTGNPQNLGSPAPGSATSASASDHVHQMPSAGDVGAIPSTALTANNPASLGSLAAPGSSPNVARLDHVHPFPTASNVGADPAGSAATAESNAQSYTDAAIKAASISSGRVVLVNLVGVSNLSAVTLNTLDPLYTPVQNDEVLITGACSPDGVTPASTAYAGVYTVGAVGGGVAALTRAANYNEAAEICGATWFVTAGTYADDFWACTNDVASTTIDVTPLVFVQIAGTLSNNAAQPLGVAGASGTDHDVSRSDHVHPFPTASDVGAVPTSRNITTTSPLSGGGSLSGDLTLSVATATNAAAGVVLLSSATPQPLGVAAAGSTGNASDAGHVHAMPTAADVGAMTNPMTTAGDLITGGASGTPGRLGIGANGTVLTVTAGAPVWAPAAGGPVIGTGTYAARPASPSIGDSYTVTSGARRGSVYRCDVAGSWSLVTLAVPQLGSCVAIFDGEHGVGRVGSILNRWVNLSPRARGYDLSYPGIGNAPQPLAASAVAGLLLEDTSSTITTLRTILPSTTATGARTIAALVRPTAYAGITTRVMEWGINGALASIGLCSRESYVDKWVVDFRGSPLASTVNSIETGLVVVVATYDGTTVRLYRESTEIASGARTLVNGADAYLSVMCGVAADNAQPGQMAFAGAWDVALSAGEVSTLTSLLRERYGI